MLTWKFIDSYMLTSETIEAAIGDDTLIIFRQYEAHWWKWGLAIKRKGASKRTFISAHHEHEEAKQAAEEYAEAAMILEYVT